MAAQSCAPALTFQSTTFDVIDRNGQPWLRAHQIGVALDYKRSDIIAKLYRANAAEFTDSMTAVVRLPTAGGMQDVRIFSLRGAHLLGMFARTKVAAEFRRWALDVLDRETAAMPYHVAPNQTLSAEQADELRSLITTHAETLPKGSQAAFVIQAWSKLKSHFGVPYRQIPASRFTEAVSIAARHVAQHCATQLGRVEEMRGRYLVRFGDDHPQMVEVPSNAYVVALEDLPKVVADPGSLSASVLFEIMQACQERLRSKFGALEEANYIMKQKGRRLVA